MSRPPPVNRSYSFEPEDETSLNSQRNHYNYSPYRDNSPARHMQPQPPVYQYDSYTPSDAPTPPLHRENPFSDPSEPSRSHQDLAYTNSHRTTSTTTPGQDNFGQRAVGGGIAGVAYGVAGSNERESGLQASRGMDSPRHYGGPESPFIPEHRSRALEAGYPAAGAGAGAGAAWAGSHHSQESMPNDHYNAQPVFADDPYNKRYSSPWDSRVDQNAFNPNDIEDDGDDGFIRAPNQRRSMLGLGRQSNSNLPAAGVGAGAAAGLAAAGSGGLEKGFKADESRRKRKRLCFIIIGIFAILAILAGAILGGVLGTRSNDERKGSGRGGSGLSAAEDDGNGDLGINSDEIKDLMNNSNLKKVFPAMDYTPYNAQYPACLSNPTSQNNITRDMAVLSQLTNTVRLYGTDCNQTDMVLHALDRLKLDHMKVWLGVWLDKNATTNARSLRDMYDVLDRNGADRFAGVIVGNEILFREDMTTTELATVISDVRQNFTDREITLPLGVADLGDNWRKDGTEFIKSVDVVMSNIHPFFAGVTAEEGSDWTHAFWQNNVVALTEGTNKQNIIAEVGWPSQGGKSCGEATTCTEGSVAGIPEMNTFMETFVCDALKNGTDFFWFEAFDEPWKEQFNEPGKEWEDRWGLMTPDRELKPGLKIPDCGGQRIKDP